MWLSRSCFHITDFCQPLQTSALNAVLFSEQELRNGFSFSLYIIFHFKSVTFILEYLGNKNFKMHHKNFPTLRDNACYFIMYIFQSVYT